MKIAIIGGAGARTPLLVRGLADSDLALEEIGLFDPDSDRMAAVAPLASGFSSSVRAYRDARACVAGADFVVLTIRAGGIAARVRDEAVARQHHVVAQEAVGAAGFATAMRAVPAAIKYARLIEVAAPQAWIVNFTDPVSIVTQAIATSTRANVIGVCDAPTELFESVAGVLGLDSSRCFFDYFGLNHLGWLREIYCDGVPQLPKLWEDVNSLARIYRAPLFEEEFLRSLRLLPTEDLFYYYRPDVALRNLQVADRTRAAAVASLNDRLFRDLAAAGVDRRAVYERYLQARSETFMQIEAGAHAPMPPRAAAVTGYGKTGVSVIRAIHRNSNSIIPLNVRNHGALRDLDADDIVEVPCVVNANGARPLAVGDMPESVEDLVMRVKDFEWLTLHAASTGEDADAVLALARHPLVDDGVLAGQLVHALKPW
jgi:6-phospho-beta-glucosidase